MFKRFRRRSAQTFNVLSLDGTILTFELEVDAIVCMVLAAPICGHQRITN